MLEILILEDQPAVREVISEVVEDLGVPLTIGMAGSLKEAREKIAAKRWDGMITDLSLGDGQSLQLIEELRQQHNDMPVILVSGFLSTDRVEHANKLNVAHVLAKPFDPETLLDCMREAFFPEGYDHFGRESKKSSSGQLLPEMFEMDRRLGLVYRMFDEMPRQKDVSDMCASALGLAMEMVRAQRGYLALFERTQNKLIMIADQGVSDDGFQSTCLLEETPFEALIHSDAEYLECLPEDDEKTACWPNVKVECYVGIPICLQGVHLGVLCLMDRPSGEPLKTDEKQHLGLLIKKLDTLLDNRALHAALQESMRETLIALVRSLEARDRYTKDHSSRVGKMSMMFARDMGFDDDVVQVIQTGGLLHDIGKVGVADAVLLKPGRYTDHEYAIMKAHPAIGDAILKNMDALVRERLMVRHHHERWDGKGYPDGLVGEDIPLEARIVCVADAIDAMTTNRVYRMAKPLSFCLEQLKAGAGSQFDEDVVKVAVAAIERGDVQTQAKDGEYDQEGLMPMMSSSEDIASEIPMDLGVIQNVR